MFWYLCIILCITKKYTKWIRRHQSRSVFQYINSMTFNTNYITIARSPDMMLQHTLKKASTENRELLWCQPSCRWLHRRLLIWQYPMAPVTAKLASWQLSNSQVSVSYLIFVFPGLPDYPSTNSEFSNIISTTWIMLENKGCLIQWIASMYPGENNTVLCVMDMMVVRNIRNNTYKILHRGMKWRSINAKKNAPEWAHKNTS